MENVLLPLLLPNIKSIFEFAVLQHGLFLEPLKDEKEGFDDVNKLMPPPLKTRLNSQHTFGHLRCDD